MPGSADAPVVLDAMGGDHAPREQVAGAVAAVREHGVRLVLAGDAGTLRPLLDEHGAACDLDVVHAPEVIAMGDSGVRMGGLPGTSAAAACGLVTSGQAGAPGLRGLDRRQRGHRGGHGGLCARGAPPGHRGRAADGRAGTVLLDAGATPDPMVTSPW
jgi:glycerol-3-phosphate acyltransferase PlsX